MSEPLLRVEGLRKHFVERKGFPRSRTITVRAVEDISFTVAPGEAFGLVGESGCGKSTAVRALLRLIEPDGGRVTYRGEDVLAARGAALKALRRRMQIVFQDPYSSLDPRQTIGSALMEPMRVHGIACCCRQSGSSGSALRTKTASPRSATPGPTSALGNSTPSETPSFSPCI